MNVFILLETRTFFMGTNLFCASDERLSVGDKPMEKSLSNFSPHSHTHTATYVATSDFQKAYIEMIATHRYYLHKLVVAITLSYSPVSMLHLQVILYAIAFSAGLHRLWVHWVDKKGQPNFYFRSYQPLMHVLRSLCVAWLYIPCPHNYWVKS